MASFKVEWCLIFREGTLLKIVYNKRNAPKSTKLRMV